MFEQDSDILVAEEEIESAEPQNESAEETSNVTFFEANENSSQAQSPTLQKETETFVKTSYNTNNLSKVYKKYDVVQTYVPAKKQAQKKDKTFETFVKQQDEFVPERETVVLEKVKQQPTYQLSQKAKSWLVATIAIFIMFGGLAIYNAVHISNLNKDIARAQYDITEVNKSIEKATKTYGRLTDEDAVLNVAEDEYGMHQAAEDEQVKIELNPKNEVKDYQRESNFFDKICEFFRHLFGG